MLKSNQFFLWGIISIVCLLIVRQFYLAAAYGFWYHQPVVHSYDIVRMFASSQIICADLPKPTRYTLHNDDSTITTLREETLDDRTKAHFMAIIADHYLKRADGNVYEPSPTTVWPYFSGHDYPAYISLYNSAVKYQDDDQKATTRVISDIVPVATMTSRPVTVHFRDLAGEPDDMPVYYVDWLCVRADHRKRGIAPRMIQTHEYRQRHGTHTIKVSLFKHEDKLLQGIVPLVVYTVYGFPIENPIGKSVNGGGAWSQQSMDGTIKWVLPVGLKMMAITKQTMGDLWDFMERQRGNYRVFIRTTVANIIGLIETGNWFIHAVIAVDSGRVVAAYFYRDSCVRLESGGGRVLTLVGSLYDPAAINEETHYFGFMKSFAAIRRKHAGIFDHCAIENIAQNGGIIERIKEHTAATIKSPCAWFFYNFIYPTVGASSAFILV